MRVTVVASGLSCGVCSGFGAYGMGYVEHPLYYLASSSSRYSYALCQNCGTLYQWGSDALAE